MSTRNVQYIISLRDKFTKNLKGANAAVKNFDKSTSQLSGTIQALGVTMGAVGAINLGKSILKLGMDMEQTNISFEVMLGSAEKANDLLEQIKKTAAKTPFELPDLLEGSKRLLAYNIEAEKIIPTLTALGNISSGVGRDKLPNLITALGQVSAKTVLAGEELRQFTETGVPLIAELAKVTGFTEKEITDKTKDLGITYDQVFQALSNMTSEGGKFNNLMARQAETAGGMLSNLQDIITQTGIALGESYLPELKNAVSVGIRWAGFLENNIDTIKTIIKVLLQAGKALVIYKATIFAMQRGLKLATIAHNSFRFAVIAHNRGLKSAITLTKSFNVAMKANVIGAVVAGLVTLVSWLRKTRNETRATVETFETLGVSKETIDKITMAASDMSSNISNFSTKELRAASQYLTDMEEAMPDITRGMAIDIKDASGNIVKSLGEFDLRDNKRKIREQIDFINRTLEEKGIKPLMSTGKVGVQQRTTKITSSAPKVINININKLIETQEINTQQLTQSASQIKSLITQTLMDALNDTQIAQKAS